jgi:hypothetical protein
MPRRGLRLPNKLFLLNASLQKLRYAIINIGWNEGEGGGLISYCSRYNMSSTMHENGHHIPSNSSLATEHIFEFDLQAALAEALDPTEAEKVDLRQVKAELARVNQHHKDKMKVCHTEQFRMVSDLTEARHQVQKLEVENAHLKLQLELSEPHKVAYDSVTALFDQP